MAKPITLERRTTILIAKFPIPYDIIGDCRIRTVKLKFRFMALTQERKQEIMGEYQAHETDTGSADLQVAMLTDRINKLSTHLKVNQKDFSSRRGLMQLIGRRRRLLSYIQKQDKSRYQALIARLGIRG